MALYCGFDFGTSNSVVTVVDDQGQVVLSEASPTLLFFPQQTKATDDPVFFGQDAIYEYVTNGMEGRFLQSIKALLPDRHFRTTLINDKPWQLLDLVALILKTMKAAVEAKLNQPIERVIMGRPVHFSPDPESDSVAQRRIAGAARIAGFSDVRFQMEPIAAAYAYEQSITEPTIVLVADLGGGTTDYTIMKLDPVRSSDSDRKADILATGGVSVGGDRLDSAVMWQKMIRYFGYGTQYEYWGNMLELPVHMFHTICRWEQIPMLKTTQFREDLAVFHQGSGRNPGLTRLINLIDHDLGYALFKEIEKAKHALSADQSANIDFEQFDIAIHDQISEPEFRSIISEEMARVEESLDHTLRDAGLAIEDIHTVFLTGGTSQVCAVQDLFYRRFGRDKVNSDKNRFTSISYGLALYARTQFA